MKQLGRKIRSSSEKKSQNKNKNCLISYVAILATLVVATYLVIYNCEDSLGDPSDQFVVKTISKLYTSLDAEDLEEKNVFEDFCTSFVPTDETLHNGKLSKREVDADEWRNPEKQFKTPNRVKRTSNFTTANENKENINQYESGDEESGEEAQIKLEPTNSSGDGDYEDYEVVHRAMHPETHMDRGPLDDVVEQIRSQPELEEEELMSSAQVYKHGQTYKDIQAFWKALGDKDTIRNTQARIMKQYMDTGADPCHDFYQYACGNWATLNPIPADKAGYDTFEMLRENLDAVLRDILAFKEYEDVVSIYPGANLDVYDSVLLKSDKLSSKPRETETMSIEDIIKPRKKKNTQIIERIRRYLEAKGQRINIHKRHRSEHLAHYKKQLKNINMNNEKRNRNKSNRKVPGKKYRKRESSRFLKITDGTKRFGRKPLISKDQRKRAERMPQPTQPHRSKREITDYVLPESVTEKNIPALDDDPAKGDAEMKARFLFKSCMDYDILHKRGHQPLIDLIDILGGWPILNPKWDAKNFDWLELMAKLRLFNNDILLSEWVGPDIKNSDEFVIQFDQTSLGLPTRDYFLQDSNKVYLKAYKDYLIKIAILLGGKPRHVRCSADKLINFEIKLAKITSAPEDRRNVSELYRRMELHKLEELVPEIKWRRYLSVVMNRDVKSNETVVLFALRYVRHLVKLIDETDPSILSNYLLWRFVRHRVNNLDDRFQSAKQQFYYVLFGREQSPPRWKNCISQVNSNMGMALGAMFVRNHFDETSKNDTLKMTREIQNSFKEILNEIEWIDEKTKRLAAHKVDAMMLRIGYPDFILDKKELDDRYKEVTIHPSKYFENILNILQHLTKMEQGRLGQPVNKSLWNTAPAVVNAYYSRNKNQIMFPAGILQPPFYHRHFPRSLNYGGIGVVIGHEITHGFDNVTGHEITHGFDDKGRLFDSDGNLHRWWSDSAIETFHLRAQCLIDQYGRYVVPEVNVKLDGASTQGENIADNGGVKQAFRAYLQWLQQHGSEGETLPGLNHTHTQLFFLNFAQVWCGAMRPEAMRNKLKTAVHSPGRFRVIGTLSNSHDFAREFKCPPGSPMNPKEKCSVW